MFLAFIRMMIQGFIKFYCEVFLFTEFSRPNGNGNSMGHLDCFFNSKTLSVCTNVCKS